MKILAARAMKLVLGVAALSIATVTATAANAELLVESGRRAALDADYVFESTGANPGDIASQEWKVRRTLSISVLLEAAAPMPTAQMHAPDAAQTAATNARVAVAEQAAAQIRPQLPSMMAFAANAEALAAKCGDNEECFLREMQRFVQGSDAAALGAAAGAAGAGLAATLAPEPPRFQVWRQVQQVGGTYAIDETLETRTRDPICIGELNDTCIIREGRKGQGAVPAQSGDGPAAIEVDAQGKTLIMRLPVSNVPLAYLRTFTSTHPEDAASVGVQPAQLMFPGALELPLSHVSQPISVAVAMRPLEVAVPGDALASSGTQTLEGKGDMNERVKLTIAWRLAVQ